MHRKCLVYAYACMYSLCHVSHSVNIMKPLTLLYQNWQAKQMRYSNRAVTVAVWITEGSDNGDLNN